MKSPAVTPTPRHAGPTLLLPALTYTALILAGGSTLNAAFRIPYDSAASTAAYIAGLTRSISWGSFCEFASGRLHFLRVRAAGATIALVGGILAAGMLLLSGLSLWSRTRPAISTADGAVRTLQAIGFAGGGPEFVVPLGLFLAGVSVTAGLHRLVPRWIMIFGLGIAFGCELASLTLVIGYAAWCIPFGRFLSILWMIAVAVCLPSRLPADTAVPHSATA